KLITPSDFDYSPYFDVIKYPMLDLDDLAVYRKLPWDRTGVHCNDIGDCFVADKAHIELIATGYENADQEVIDDRTIDESGDAGRSESEPSGSEKDLNKHYTN
ncbi:MAG: hypothetical protein HKP12_05535, partial [Gammaproteobacteria bacterium]|nr:hypothetical protein [Gammaproteobacteria bacterium]